MRKKFEEVYEVSDIEKTQSFETKTFGKVWKVETKDKTFYTICKAGLELDEDFEWENDEILEFHEVAYLKLAGELNVK